MHYYIALLKIPKDALHGKYKHSQMVQKAIINRMTHYRQRQHVEAAPLREVGFQLASWLSPVSVITHNKREPH